MEVSFNNIKNRIKEDYIHGLYFMQEYKNDTDKKVLLSLALGSKESITEEIHSLLEIVTSEYKMYEYESSNTGTDKVVENFLISKNNLPLLRIAHYQPKNNSIDYSEDTYIIYRKNSNHIESKISITSLKTDDFEDTSVTVLNSDESFNIAEYYQKKYHFVIQDDEILSLRIGNEMFLNGEKGFSLRCDSALKCIGKVFHKIMQKIDKTMDEDVKEYHILRKKQEH